MSEKTMFPREDHTEMLFQKILNDPWACDRLMETFNENLVYNDEFDVSLPAEKFAKALFNAYTNRDLSALLMCLCNNTVFDLLRNSYIIPYRFNADGHQKHWVPILIITLLGTTFIFFVVGHVTQFFAKLARSRNNKKSSGNLESQPSNSMADNKD